MSFVQNEAQQIALHDSFARLSPRAKAFMEKSWAESFSRHVFEQINEERFSVIYSDNPASRPNTPVNVIVGLLILKEKMGFTDEECVEYLMFNVQAQYALRTTSFDEQPISDRTLSRFRERCERYFYETGIDLIKEEMKSLAAYQASILGVTSRLMRMDSLMVDSSCKKMSRLELLYTVVRNLVLAVVKAGYDSLLDERLVEYTKEGDKNNVCYRLEKERVSSKLEEIIQDAVKIRDICVLVFTEPQQLDTLKEYQLLERMLSDQTVEEDGVVTLKPGKDVATDSLQNPSDEDATYREKAGVGHKGYTANLVEASDETGNVVMDFDVQPNTHTDDAFAKEVIEGLDETVETLTVDGAYATADTVAQAEEKGIDLVSGKLSGPATNPIIVRFERDENGMIVRCPFGKCPISCCRNKSDDTTVAHFLLTDCEGCPLFGGDCIAKAQKNTVVVRITDTQTVRALQASKMRESKYREVINKRNGVEGLPSLLRRKYAVDSMPVRGLVRVGMWFALKVGAINAERLMKAVALA